MKKAVAAADKGQLLIGSFQGTADGSGDVDKYVADFVLAARLVKETGVEVFEANLSCPNEGRADVLCFDIERTELIARAVKNEIGDLPLILKIAYMDDARLRKFVSTLGPIVQGLSAINTIQSLIIDKDGEPALPGKGRERSGVCGAGIKWAGVEMTKKLKKLREELNLTYAIIGVGGVVEPEDYFEYRAAGADAVLSATGAMWNPKLAQEILTAEK